MISRQDLKDLLAQRPDSTGKILSVYLNVDQANANNLNRGFETALKSVLQKLEQRLEGESERKKFLSSAQRVTALVSEYKPEGKTLVLFCDEEGEFTWQRSLSIPLESEAHWMPRPYIRPLLEARDEFERTGFILTDRAHARLFTIFMGSIEEHHEALAEDEVKKFDASPSDQLRSQMHLQRKADEHARLHLKRVAEMMDRMARNRKFDRLILGGTPEAVGELKNLLSDTLTRKLIGTVNLSIDDSSAEILEAILALELRIERESEQKRLETLFTAAAKENQAVVGLEPTLSALRVGRIRELVYTDRSSKKGYQCRKCATLYSSNERSCSACSGELVKTEDLLEVIVEKVFISGGSVEHVRKEAAAAFDERAGGIGAFLRF